MHIDEGDREEHTHRDSGLSLSKEADSLVPRGPVGKLDGKILGCRELVALHDAQGHPLLATTFTQGSATWVLTVDYNLI